MKKLKQKEKLFLLMKSKKMMKKLSKLKYLHFKKVKARNFHIHKYAPVYSFLESINFANKHNFKINTFNNNIPMGIVDSPKTLDLINNTDETLLFLKNFFYVGSHKATRGIFLNQSNTTYMSLCTSLLLVILYFTIEERYKNLYNEYSFAGKYTNHISDLMEVSGLIKYLDENSEIDKKNVISLELLSSNSNRLNYSQEYYCKYDEVSKKVINYFNKCLKTQRMILNENGERFFGNTIGEIMDNCILHADTGNTELWFCSGYAKKLEVGITECSLVIFNFGSSIYEGIKNSKEKKIYRQLKTLYNDMQGGNNFTEENIITLLAMQDGISRLISKKEPDRGTGTVRLITEFQKIGQTVRDEFNPEMAIISGKTKILFNNNYSMKEAVFGNSSRNVIFFNKENSAEYCPDSKNVIKLKESFPGTIITIKIYLDNTHLKSLKNK